MNFEIQPHLMTRRFSNHESRLLLRSHTFCNHCNIRFDPIPAETWKNHWPLDDLWPQVCWGHMCDSTQGSLYASLLKIPICVQVPWEYINVCGYSDQFCNIRFDPYLQKLERSLTSTWHLTPNLLRSHVLLYPRIIVTKSHENTSKYVDTVTFSKTWTKGHWPLDDLWPHICWGHMCDSTQGLLCPSPMGIHQCMWIQWSIFQKIPHTTYILHTEWVISHIVSFWTQFRQDNNINLDFLEFSVDLNFLFLVL